GSDVNLVLGYGGLIGQNAPGPRPAAGEYGLAVGQRVVAVRLTVNQDVLRCVVRVGSCPEQLQTMLNIRKVAGPLMHIADQSLVLGRLDGKSHRSAALSRIGLGHSQQV